MRSSSNCCIVFFVMNMLYSEVCKSTEFKNYRVHLSENSIRR